MTDWLALACGSRSMSRTFLFNRLAAYQAIWVARVVLPTPPFMLMRETHTAMCCSRFAVRLFEGWSWQDNSRHPNRSEEHTSELQSRQYLVCRLLLDKTY